MSRSPNHRIPRWLAALVAVCLLASSAPLFAAPPPGREAPPPKPIVLDSRPETDRAIEQRLGAIYAEFESLRGIDVEVRAGVVHLGGEARTLEAELQAEAIAERVEGVVAVTSDIEQDAELHRRMAPVFEQMLERVGGWLSYLPLVMIAVGVMVLAWLITRVLARRSRRRGDSGTFVRQFVGQLVRAGILVIGMAIALEVLGASGLLGALIGTVGVIGIVLGIAFKSIGEAYIASIMLSLRRPFDPDDYVRIEDVEGAVVRLTSRATMLMTLDGNLVSIPNSKVFGATIVNYTRNPQRRFSFELGVALDAELRRVQEVAVATLASVPGVVSEPRPVCLIAEFGDSAMIISVAGWIDQRRSDWLKVSSEAKHAIKSAFDRAGIEVPEPSFRIRTSSYEPREAITSEPKAEPALDVSPDDHLDRQIADERASPEAEDDLLREGGARE